MTPADEVGKCPECGSIDRGTRYLINPPTEGNPLGTFCTNAWHHVPPEVHQDEFTALEFEVMFAVCVGSRNADMIQQFGITESTVQTLMCSIYDKLGTSTRLELVLLVRHVLNAERLRHKVARGDRADETRDFTELEFKVMFAVCRGLSSKEVAELCGITESEAQTITYITIFNKIGVSNRLELHQFVRAALNAELRRRTGPGESA